MKEVTEWNGKPRWMWCWDYDECKKEKRYVYCVLTDEQLKESDGMYPVKASGGVFEHCAEIEEETTRLTEYELSQLLKCFGVEYSLGKNTSCFNSLGILIEYENTELADGYKIRYKQGEWEEPTRETVWKWWGEETPGNDISRFISFMGWDTELRTKE